MSVLALQFGQCGNQLGHSLFRLLEEDQPGLHRWFVPQGGAEWRPRAVLVDTETKVVDAVKGSFQGVGVVAPPLGGSANNWACGYTETGPLLVEDVLNCVRVEAERCDFLLSFLGLLSLAGGTGSGVGSRVLEQLRLDYPKKTLVNCVVLPHPTGEIATQGFNCLLSLARMYPLAQATVLLGNAPNRALALQLAALLQPLPAVSVAQLCAQLAPHPGLRLLQVRPPSEDAPHYALKRLMAGPSQKVVAQALIQRGDAPLPAALQRQFVQSVEGVDWVPQAQIGRIWRTDRGLLGRPRLLSRVSNSGGLAPLDALVSDAWGAFTHGAYVHHYSKFGVDAQWFLDAFQDVEDVLGAYRAL
ncbi:tubulin delta chain-like [Dendroctonus ponderosae]|uniref:Tubulin/FtsZ GTPase domain-containing protein n=1 Tax=Dendroctonus ponderosae TaxID=77166 RepID=A0AAR5Q1V7_DENPD|nr:tubulin delta chain-like [Dendroctonus ponderosae]KAH1000302.1 hypothetical protein HUJ04_000220 [Dendroctonus ponderosae]